MFELRGTGKDLIAQAKQLESEAWIDKYTRAIIIEFTVYNPGTNLFAICTMLLEMPASSSFAPKWR